jgi:hypothetical protein
VIITERGIEKSTWKAGTAARPSSKVLGFPDDAERARPAFDVAQTAAAPHCDPAISVSLGLRAGYKEERRIGTIRDSQRTTSIWQESLGDSTVCEV